MVCVCVVVCVHRVHTIHRKGSLMEAYAIFIIVSFVIVAVVNGWMRMH